MGIVRAGAPDAFHSTPGMTDYVDPMGPMTQGPTLPTITAPAVRPYDAQYEQTVNNINAGKAALQSGSDLATKRVGEDFDVARDSAVKSNTNQLSALQNRLANQGIGYSGINITEQGKLGESLQEQIAALTKSKTRTEEDITRTKTTGDSDLQRQLGQAEIDRSNRDNERAKEVAAQEAQALAEKSAGDQQRQWMAELQSNLLKQVQPVATPTGQMQVNKAPPQQVIQNALKQLPQPAIPMAPPDMIRNIQDELRHQGLDPGPTDGAVGPRTLTAYNQWRAKVLNLGPVGRITMDDVNLMASNPGITPGLAGMNMGGVPGSRPGGNQA